MARLVVTGGMGFIGSAFVRPRAASPRDEVVVVDKLTYAGNPNNLKEHRDDPRLTFVKGDVCDGGLMDRVAKGADAAAHFAAETRGDAPRVPKGPYAASKAGADRLASSYHATYGLPVVISRCTNNYGPYQHPEKLIPLFVTNALEDKPLPVDGSGASAS